MKILPLLTAIGLCLSCLGNEKLNIPELRNTYPSSAYSEQAPYSGLHAVRQSIDSSLDTNNWHVTGQSIVQGEFNFSPDANFDLIQFYSPSFRQVEISIFRNGKTENLGTFTLDASDCVMFPKRLTNVQSLSIKVDSGARKYFALKELEFKSRVKSNLETLATKVFTDVTCSKIRDNYSMQDYQALPKLLQNMEFELKRNRYADKEFRIASYKAFSRPELSTELRHIKALNKFDNPTGIYAKEGEEIYAFVGATHGQTIYLASVKPYSLQSHTYPLFEGFNKIDIKQTGLLYVLYYADLTKKPKPITIHFPKGSGVVNGYFDITKHNDKDWKKMITKAKAEVFDIVGRYSMMILDSRYLKKYSADNITNSVKVWDASMRAIWMLQGFHIYKQPINNRQLGFSSDSSAYMFSTEYGCGYSSGPDGSVLRNEILAPSVIEGTHLWGIGHEVGHSNQELINWPSMTEGSNNLFAQLLLDQVAPLFNGGKAVSDMENPCKYLLSEVVKGTPFHDLNGWVKWGFAQYSFYLYFHKLGFNPKFYPELYESLRKSPMRFTNDEIAKAHLMWYERICNLTKTDFTEDFETFNWFVPCDIKANQYGDYHFKLTQGMADEAKARIAAKNYPKPKCRIAFMHQHEKEIDLWGRKLKGSELNGYWTKYKANAQLDPKVSARKNGDMIYITHGENAAAFCIKTDGKIVGYYDRPQFSVADIPWNDSSELYAIPIQTAQPYKKVPL